MKLQRLESSRLPHQDAGRYQRLSRPNLNSPTLFQSGPSSTSATPLAGSLRHVQNGRAVRGIRSVRPAQGEASLAAPARAQCCLDAPNDTESICYRAKGYFLWWLAHRFAVAATADAAEPVASSGRDVEPVQDSAAQVRAEEEGARRGCRRSEQCCDLELLFAWE
ncbi:hypothetical protein ON010_g18508 [Phytophthora cinnamomi]|nr:hypothetical protein ON010_g18508 [Phytophthora cinnamomi]